MIYLGKDEKTPETLFLRGNKYRLRAIMEAFLNKSREIWRDWGCVGGAVKPLAWPKTFTKARRKAQIWYVQRTAHSMLLNEGYDLKEQWETHRIGKNAPPSGPELKLGLIGNAGEQYDFYCNKTSDILIKLIWSLCTR